MFNFFNTFLDISEYLRTKKTFNSISFFDKYFRFFHIMLFFARKTMPVISITKDGCIEGRNKEINNSCITKILLFKIVYSMRFKCVFHNILNISSFISLMSKFPNIITSIRATKPLDGNSIPSKLISTNTTGIYWNIWIPVLCRCTSALFISTSARAETGFATRFRHFKLFVTNRAGSVNVSITSACNTYLFTLFRCTFLTTYLFRYILNPFWSMNNMFFTMNRFFSRKHCFATNGSTWVSWARHNMLYYAFLVPKCFLKGG